MPRILIAKEFHFSPSISLPLKQLEQHRQIYMDYINKYNEIKCELHNYNCNQNNSPYSYYQSLKKAESSIINSIKLHELYFENIVEQKKEVTPQVKILIEQSFLSYDIWLKDFSISGLASNAWVIMAYEPLTKSVHNYVQNDHDLGAVWQARPLLVLDVSEHAYLTSFGINKEAYIKTFIEHIDWDVIEKRLE